MLLRRPSSRMCATLAWTRHTSPPEFALARVPKPWKRTAAGPDDGALLLRADKLVPEHSLRAAKALLLDPSLNYDCDSDSVDGQPTFEIRWVASGQYTDQRLEAIFREVVEQRLVPLLEASPLAGGASRPLVLCEALVRMYDENARRVHPAHYDGDALVTAVVELDTSDDDDAAARADVPHAMRRPPPARQKGFAGGFYVQPGADVASRLPIALEPGDVIAHSFDLQHGVAVSAGRRCSVIFWFVDTLAACADKSRPWYAAAAAAGDADAQYNRAKDLDRMGKDPRAAQALMRAAAGQGLPVAQNDLAAMLMAGRGCAGGVPDVVEAERWLAAAASAGFYRAMYGLALLCGRCPGREEEALDWLQRAAEERADPDIMHRLGLAYRDGYGAAVPNEASARSWLREAARMGHPASQYALGELLLRERLRAVTAGTSTAEEAAASAEAEGWLRRASNQLHPDAALLLGRLYVSQRSAQGLLWLLSIWGAALLRPTSKSHESRRVALTIGLFALMPVVAMGALSESVSESPHTCARDD